MFHRCFLAPPIPPRHRDFPQDNGLEGSDFHNHVKLVHQVLFCFLLGQRVEYAEEPHRRMNLIADVVAYAEFYGIRQCIAGRVEKDMLEWNGLRQDVGKQAYFHMLSSYPVKPCSSRVSGI